MNVKKERTTRVTSNERLLLINRDNNNINNNKKDYGTFNKIRYDEEIPLRRTNNTHLENKNKTYVSITKNRIRDNSNIYNESYIELNIINFKKFKERFKKYYKNICDDNIFTLTDIAFLQIPLCIFRNKYITYSVLFMYFFKLFEDNAIDMKYHSFVTGISKKDILKFELKFIEFKFRINPHYLNPFTLAGSGTEPLGTPPEINKLGDVGGPCTFLKDPPDE